MLFVTGRMIVFVFLFAGVIVVALLRRGAGGQAEAKRVGPGGEFIDAGTFERILRLHKAGGLDEHAVKAVLALEQPGEDPEQIAADGAAKAPVVHGENLFIGLDDELIVHADLAEFVFDDGDFAAVLLGEHAVQQCGLAGTEKTGEDGDRNAVIGGHGKNSGNRRPEIGERRPDVGKRKREGGWAKKARLVRKASVANRSRGATLTCGRLTTYYGNTTASARIARSAGLGCGRRREKCSAVRPYPCLFKEPRRPSWMLMPGDRCRSLLAGESDSGIACEQAPAIGLDTPQFPAACSS